MVRDESESEALPQTTRRECAAYLSRCSLGSSWIRLERFVFDHEPGCLQVNMVTRIGPCRAGVDLEDAAPFRDTFSAVNDHLDEVETLLGASSSRAGAR